MGTFNHSAIASIVLSSGVGPSPPVVIIISCDLDNSSKALAISLISSATANIVFV